MKLKIISDGTSEGTKVINAATGEEIEGVERIQWTVTGAGVSVDLMMVGVPIEVTGEVKE